MLRLVPLFHNHPKRSYGVDEMTPAVSVDFALNGQSNNPSGHINFSNVATQQLKMDIRGRPGKTYVIDVYAVGLKTGSTSRAALPRSSSTELWQTLCASPAGP